AGALRAKLPALGLPAPFILLHARLGDSAAAARQLAEQAGPEGLDAVMLGLSGQRARAAAAALATALPARPRFMGPATWAAEPGLGTEPALADAWFPGPDPGVRAQFDSRYQSTFGERPPRLAGIAYDAAALASRSVRDGRNTPPVGEALLGADGPIRLTPEGLAQRGLAIFALDPAGGEPRLIQPAPVPGAPAS
ncbi:hypothetical protein JYK14_28020, partial [Siccirubricoccus sp. KC 17139]|nr:hypothetical protein [Siccirubricoccus soli]MCP2686116.1 hypothetical protein [Siccirubricoccus soli]